MVNLMCFHITLPIRSTHAHTHIETHAQVYEQTQVSIRFIHAYTKAHTHMVCSLHLSYSGGAPTCPQISAQGKFWHRKYIINTLAFCKLMKVHTHTHTHTHSSAPPLCKSTHSQMRRMFNLSSRVVKEIKQEERGAFWSIPVHLKA